MENQEQEPTIQEKLRTALAKYFEPAEDVTAQHILYKQFVEEYGQIISKFDCYLSWVKAWGNPYLKDANGDLGFKMKVIPKN